MRLRLVWLRAVALAFLLGAAPLAGTFVQFRTPVGDLELELLDRERPETVRNFLAYVETGRYRDTILHRLLPNLFAQGGAYGVTNRGTGRAAFRALPTLPAIANERRPGDGLTNGLGWLALGAVDNRPRPLQGEFILGLGNGLGPFLTTNQGGYPVFGRVTRGLEVLRVLNGFSEANDGTNQLITIFDAVLPPSLFGVAEFPLTRFRLDDPAAQFRHALYVDITLLRVAITTGADGARTIAWDSVAGRTNVVEFTDVFPPQWRRLAALAGTGARLSVPDATPAARRFYRVLVEPPPGTAAEAAR
jgi:cyclophilin family peptidyl-prolyl cis-trans isomerase